MRIVKLGDVCEFKPAKSLTKSKLGDDANVSFSPMEQLPIGRKYFTPSQTRKLGEVYSNYVYFEENDVIYAKITPCFENGKMSIAKNITNGVGFGSSEFVPVRCSDKILPEYLYYFLLKPSFIEYGSQNMRGASGHRRVPDDFTKELLIALPDIKEQRQVVERLDAAFEKIDRAIELTEKNIIQIKNLYQKYLADTFSQSESWNQQKLEANIKFIDYRGKTPKKTQYGIRLITAKNIKMGYVNPEPREYVSPEIYDSWMVRGVPIEGDVLFTTEAPLANVAQLDVSDRVVFAQRCIILQPDRNIIQPSFLKFALLADPVRSSIFNSATGTTVSGIRAALLKKIDIYVPNLNIQKCIISDLNNVEIKTSEVINLYQEKVKSLRLLKQSLLSQSLTESAVK